MNLRILRTQAYLTTFIIIQTHGYVLLAANLDQFKSVARKFVPEKLANQLANLASHSPIKRTTGESQEDSVTESESQSDENDDDNMNRRDTSDIPKQNNIRLTKVNFEELVQKVKERIQKDFESQKVVVAPNEKVLPQIHQPKKLNVPIEVVIQEHTPMKVSRFVNERRKRTTKSLKQTEQKEISLYDQPVAEDGMTFARIELKDNDDYEDYVTPAKEEDIFETDVHDKTKITTKKQGTETESIIEYEYHDDTGELKAKTEDIVFDYKQTDALVDYEDTTPMNKNRRTTKKTKATMIPKRDFYKISSPNYLAKVPIVAEKYDFDEPIPKKDQEPDNLKPIKALKELYPAIINGKVKLK